MSYGTVGNLTTTMPTAREMIATMRDLQRRSPKSATATALTMHPHLYMALEDRLPHASGPMDHFAGLPIRECGGIPPDSFIEEMADGSRVMHYKGGLTVRCLPESEPAIDPRFPSPVFPRYRELVRRFTR